MRNLIKDFSGGLTDFPYNSQDNRSSICENLLPTPTKGLKTRDGSSAYYAGNPRIINTRIDSLLFEDDIPMWQSGENLYINSATAITGGSKLSSSELITNGTFASDLSGWTVSGTGAGWIWEAGVARKVYSPNETLTSSNISVTAGKSYFLSFKAGQNIYNGQKLSVLIIDGTGSAQFFENESNTFSVAPASGLMQVSSYDAGTKTVTYVYTYKNDSGTDKYTAPNTLKFWGSSGTYLGEDTIATTPTDNTLTLTSGIAGIGGASVSVYKVVYDLAYDNYYLCIRAITTGNIQLRFQQSGSFKSFNGYIDSVSLKEIQVSTETPFTAGDYIDYSYINGKIYFGSTSKKYSPIIFNDSYHLSGTRNWSLMSSGLYSESAGISFVTNNGNKSGSYAYQYAAVISYTYYSYNNNTGQTTEYTIRGDPVYSTSLSLVAPIGAGSFNEVTVNVENSEKMFDIYRIETEIYRTQQNQTTFYKVAKFGQLTNSFYDYYTDAQISINDILYTDSGIIRNEPLPKAKYIATHSGTLAFANVDIILDPLIGTYTSYSSRVYQGNKDGENDYISLDNWVDAGRAITGLSSISNYFIVFTDRTVHRMEGLIDNTGSGYHNLIEIHNKVGCISGQSVVKSKDAVYWAAQDGFYVTNGFEVKKLIIKDPESFNNTYLKIINVSAVTENKNRISGSFDYVKNRVYWTVNDIATTATDNNKILVYDINSDGFFFLVGDTSSTNNKFSPTALAFNNTGLIRGTKDGCIYQHSVNSTTAIDVLDTGVNHSIVSKFKHIGYDFEDPCAKKYVTNVVLNASNNGDLAATVYSYDDGNTVGDQLEGIAFVSASDGKKIIKTNRMNGNSMRCNHKQIYIETSGKILELDSISYVYENLDIKTSGE